jgi:hypothetical protein
MRNYLIILCFLFSSVFHGEASAQAVNKVRFQLTGNALFYVSTAGNDMTGDGSSGAPWATVQQAYNWVADNLDFAGHNVQIQLMPGVYTYGVMINRSWIGGGNLIIDGGGATINSNKPNVGIFDFSMPIALPGVLTIENMTLTSGVAIYGINAECFCTVNLGPGLVFGQMTYIHISALNGGYVYCSYGYSITGGANNHFNATHGSIQCPRQIALSGTPKFGAFAVALESSLIDLRSAVFSGSATGERYYVNTLSLFLTGGELVAVPGNATGYVGGGGIAN